MTVLACRTCGYLPAPGADWSHIELRAIEPGFECAHMNAYRYCRSCSEYWHRVGMTPDFDVDCVGDPPRYVASVGSEECPDCIAHTGDDGHYHDVEQPTVTETRP